MFCPECGVKNTENAVFCENCGSRIADEPQKISPRIPPLTPIVIPEPPLENFRNEEFKHAQVPVVGKKRGRGVRKFILVELVVLALVGFGFYTLSEVITNPKEIAYRYIVDVHNRNWNNLYNSLSLPKSEFINKEMLMKGNPSTDSMDVENYTISDIEFSPDRHKASVTIDYNLPGVVNSTSTQVNLIKQAKKKYLIFDSWKIVPEFVVADYEVKVPTNSQVTLGGVALEPSLIKDQNVEFTYYQIPMVFDGNYEVKVVLESMEDSVQEVSTSNGVYSLNKMVFDRDVQKNLLLEAGKVFTATYEAAFAKNGFATIQKLFSTDATKVPLLMDEYVQLSEELENGTDFSMVSISFNRIDAVTDYYISDQTTYVDVTLDFAYQYKYISEDNWGDYYEGDSEANGSAVYTFAKNGEDWKIIEFDIVY